MALVKTIMESDETYNWLKDQAAADPEAHTKCIAGLEANRGGIREVHESDPRVF